MTRKPESGPADAALADRWSMTTWEGNRRWQAERALDATPLERLRWLESALELAHAAGAVPRRRPEDPGSSSDEKARPRV